MEAVIYIGSYWEDIENLNLNKKDIPRFLRTSRYKDSLQCMIDGFQLRINVPDPMILCSPCLPHKSPLDLYTFVGKGLTGILRRGLTKGEILNCEIVNGKLINLRRGGKEETFARLIGWGHTYFIGGVLSKMPHLSTLKCD